MGMLAAALGCDPGHTRSVLSSSPALSKPNWLTVAALAPRSAAQPQLLARRAVAPAVRFMTEKGEAVTLDRFAGRVVVLSLWTSPCEACEANLASLDQLAQSLPSVAIIPVRLEPPVALVGSWHSGRDHPLDHLSFYQDSDGSLMRQFRAHDLPTSFVIDRKGRIAAVVSGRVNWTSEAMLALLLRI